MKETSILLRPIVSEKSRDASVSENVYTFAVHRSATKPLVRDAVEKRYSVNVKDVKITNTPRRVSRFRGRRVSAHNVKKAMVKLKEGQTIDVFQV